MKLDPNQLIYQPARYEIIVPGKLDPSWLDWLGDRTTVEEIIKGDIMISKISGIFDQASLQGLIRRLYVFGLPIISLNCMPINSLDSSQ